jgi:hypothetical protein
MTTSTTGRWERNEFNRLRAEGGVADYGNAPFSSIGFTGNTLDQSKAMIIPKSRKKNPEEDSDVMTTSEKL